ncbi:calmodulin-lysine N-methyltransferase [Astyanax mexicanus]|uniref:Calmodulin-lysine N-methyltransferase n=1 Tax=Astyanax mexicanus TaxID=7994 RepID=A0A8T2LW40_ASTMX|nr:calmodulin-lysine N-methyltransferase [Astyanax mexicanus]
MDSKRAGRPSMKEIEHPDCGSDVARARWTILRQVLRQRQLDSAEVQQVSVRRFSSFNLFSRAKVSSSESDDPVDGQWVEYRSACFPQYSAFLRDNLGPIRVNEVLNSFDNTGNVCSSSRSQISLETGSDLLCLSERRRLGFGDLTLGGIPLLYTYNTHTRIHTPASILTPESVLSCLLLGVLRQKLPSGGLIFVQTWRRSALHYPSQPL